MSRLTDHAVGTLDIGYLIRPKQKAVKEQKFVVVKNKRKNKTPDGNRIRRKTCPTTLLSICLWSSKKQNLNDTSQNMKRLKLCYVNTNGNHQPKSWRKLLGERSAARKALDSLISKIDDGKTLHMSIEIAKKEEASCNEKDAVERKIFKDEMQPVMPGLYISGWKPASDKNI